MSTTTSPSLLPHGHLAWPRVAREALLACGVLAPVLYVASDALAALRFPGYDASSQAISELSATDAPTRSLLLPLYAIHDLLVIAFGAGVWRAAHERRGLRATGGLLIAIAALGLLATRFPMHARGVAPTFVDSLHVALAGVVSFSILVAIGFSARAFGPRFRAFAIATIAAIVVLGAATAPNGPRLAAGLPTPWLGVTERLLLAAYLVWMAVLAVQLLREAHRASPSR